MANRIVIVAGSPGAGKTSVLRGVEKDKNYKIINIGDLMIKRAMMKDYISDRDQLRTLNNKISTELRSYAFGRVSKMSGNLLLDTHTSIETRGRYIPGLPLDIVRRMKGLVAFIYVDASTEEIVMRRRADKSRKREEEDRVLIDIQRLINMSVLLSYSSYLNIPLYVIINRQNMLEKSVNQLKKHLNDIFGENK